MFRLRLSPIGAMTDLGRWLRARSRRETRLRAAALLALAIGGVFALWVRTCEPFDAPQRQLSDALFARQQASPNIVLVVIDDQALATYEGRLSEWPRSRHATAIENIHRAGARVIAYDILFADPSDEDEALVAAMSEAGSVLLPVVGSGAVIEQSDAGYAYDAVLLPPPSIRAAAAGLAHVNVVIDPDGTVRRIPLAVREVDGSQYPAMALAVLYLQLGQPLPPGFQPEGDHLEVLDRDVPIEDGATMRINYLGGTSSFTTIPFTEVVDGSFDAELVRHKAVLIGTTASGIDVHSAPLEGRTSGLEIHANALDTLLRARFLEPASANVTLVVVLVLVGVSAILLPRWRLAWGLLFVLAVGAAYVGLGAFLFGRGHIVNFVYPPAALGLVFVTTLAYRTIAERAARSELRDLFGRYVSPQVAEALVDQADREELQLGGEMREVSILFADVRGFTPLSQRLTPQELVDVLNRHFDIIISHAMKNDGIINHFAGDCVMAIWNAPRDQREHVLLACRTALGAQQDLEALTRSSADFPVVRFGFGINTGEAVAGNIGSAGRLDYTVIGDSVNIASRLCGAAPAGEVWIGQRTYELAKERIEVEELALQSLKGVATPVAAHRLRAIGDGLASTPSAEGGQSRQLEAS